jgi:hypothetical protein
MRMSEFLTPVRVIRVEPQAGDSIRIIALELHDVGFAVRWELPTGLGPLPESAKEAGLNPFGLISLTLRDDLGTQYQHAGIRGERLGGVSLFKPAIPAEAGWLEIFIKDGIVRFDLRSAE